MDSGQVEDVRPTSLRRCAATVERDARLRAPRSAGVAGIIFAVFFIAASWLVSPRPPEGLDAAGLVEWWETSARTAISIATLYLAPFAGIAFLWFIGVVRARIGDREDQLFSTVFLGSGLLFVAMYWAGAAQLVSLLGENRYDAAPALTAEDIEAARSEAYAFLFVLAARAAGVFMLVTSTIILRARIMPKAIAYIGYLIAAGDAPQRLGAPMDRAAVPGVGPGRQRVRPRGGPARRQDWQGTGHGAGGLIGGRVPMPATWPSTMGSSTPSARSAAGPASSASR